MGISLSEIVIECCKDFQMSIFRNAPSVGWNLLKTKWALTHCSSITFILKGQIKFFVFVELSPSSILMTATCHHRVEEKIWNNLKKKKSNSLSNMTTLISVLSPRTCDLCMSHLKVIPYPIIQLQKRSLKGLDLSTSLTLLVASDSLHLWYTV